MLLGLLSLSLIVQSLPKELDLPATFLPLACRSTILDSCLGSSAISFLLDWLAGKELNGRAR